MIIGANGFQNKLILKAKIKAMLPMFLHGSAEILARKTADYFYPISITEKEKILRKCREIDPVGHMLNRLRFSGTNCKLYSK